MLCRVCFSEHGGLHWMSTLYQILGLPPTADREQVKAAFRLLARQFHPDLNGHNPHTAQRFTEVRRAYEILTDPHARAAYDGALSCEREALRKRFWSLAVTATSTGALTAAAVVIAVLWSQSAGMPQSPSPHAAGAGGTAQVQGGQGMQPTSQVSTPSAGSTAPATHRGATWATYRNRRFRFALKYPADVFAFDAQPASDHGVTLTSANGGATLRIFAARNVTGTSVARYRRQLIRSRYAGVDIDYMRQSKFGFVLSGLQGQNVLYEHVSFSCDGKSIYGWQLSYPSGERTLYDLVADEMYRNASAGMRCGAADEKPRSRARL